MRGYPPTVPASYCPRTAILGTQACGLRNQVRDRIDGRLVHNAGEPDELAAVLNEMLDSPGDRDYWARNAQRRVHDESLVFTQVRDWLRVLAAKKDPKCEMRRKPRNRKS